MVRDEREGDKSGKGRLEKGRNVSDSQNYFTKLWRGFTSGYWVLGVGFHSNVAITRLL